MHHVERMKVLCSRLPVDYFQKVVSFQRRTDAAAVLLTFDSGGKAILDGYRFSMRFPTKVGGLESFPPIFCYPQR
jgi:hypothetical protein